MAPRIVLLSALLAAPFLAHAQQESRTPARERSASASASAVLSEADRKFLQLAADSGAKEFQLAERALEKSQTDAVQRFAKRMVADHGRLNRDIHEVSNKLAASGGPPFKKESRQVEHEVERLGKLSGADFDRAYMELMVKDHERAVELYEREAERGQDPQLKALAQKALPTLREHLDRARETSAQVSSR